MKRISIYILLALLPIVAGCSKEEFSQDTLISFAGGNDKVDEVVKAGSSLVDTDSELRGKSFGVYGLRSGTNSNFTEPVFETAASQKVTYNGAEWEYSPLAKWVRSNYYRFRAFWPYEDIIADDLLNSGSDANLISLSYSSGVQNYDLQVAYVERYPVEEGVGTVEMNFKHVLSALKFNVKFHESVENDDYLTSFYLKGLTIVGTLMYGEDGTNATLSDFRWIPIYTDNETKLFEWSGSKLFNKTTPATVFDNDGVVFLVPQSIVADGTSLNFTTNKGGSALHHVTIPPVVWEPGKYLRKFSNSSLKIFT